MLWSNSGEDEALELLSELGGATADADFTLQLAGLQLQRNQFDTALELVDSITVVDQGLLRQRELMALQVAERLGDTERARQAAERLFGMRLDAQTQLQLIDPMRRLGLRDLADAILARAQRSTATNQPETMATLMSLYRGQGKTQEAQKLAFALLGRTVSPITSLVSSNQSPRYQRGNTSEASARTAALRLLKETGELDSMIADLEERIERFPDVMRSYELLVEYYEATGARDKSLALLERTVELQPQAYALRLKLAESYSAQQKHSEACDQYLKVLEDRPAWILDDFYRYTNVFRQAKRSEDIVKTLAKMDLRQMRQPWAISNVISQMMSEDSESEATIMLLEKAVKQLPSFRGDLLRNINGEGAYQNDRIFNLVLKGLIPTRLEMRTNPWAGLDDIYSYSGTGTISTQFGQLLENVSDPTRIAEVEAALRKAVEANPQWSGGKLMLALIGLKSGNDRDAAKQVLTELSSNEETLKSMPSTTCWLLGQELESFEDQRKLSVKMLELAMTKGEADGSLQNQLQYSPMVKLIANYRKEGRNAEAKETLLRLMKTSRFDNYDLAYASSQRVEQSMWCAGQLTELGYPASAIQLYQRALADRDALTAAGSYRSSNDQYYLSQAKRGLASALKMIGRENLEEVLGELFTVDSGAKPGREAFELLLSFPPTPELGSKKIDSPMMELITTLSADPAAASALNKRLAQLREDRPDDLSVLVLAIRALGTQDQATAMPFLDDAVAWTEQHPLDEIAANRRANSRQRKEAEQQLPLWLIAQPLLGTPLWETHGQQLAERALEAADRQLSDEPSVAMLFEWATGMKSSERAQAEEIWIRLAVLASKRPTATTGDDPAASANGKRVPPLTQSQFDVIMQIAKRTAQLGMADISLNIVSDALAGGLPVPDASASGVTSQSYAFSSMGGAIVQRSTRTSNTMNQDANVAIALNEVVRAWQGSGFEPQRVFDTLLEIVFPEEQPSQLRMMANSSGVYNMQPASLGQLLVQWGKRCDQLPLLIERLEQRAKADDSLTRVPAEVLKTFIALESDNLEGAASSLKKLEQLAKEGMARDDLQLSLHAGIPAANKPELEEQAMTLLSSVLSQLKQPQPSSDPFGGSDPFGNNSGASTEGKLQAAVNKYLASKGSLDSLAGMFEERLARIQGEYANYSGDYAVYRQWMELANIANEAATLDAPKLAMMYLGRVADLEIERYSRPSTEMALTTTVDMTRKMEAEERFRTWAEWTLPKDDRRTLRFAVEWIGGVNVPDEFATIPREARRPSGLMLSNFEELVDAASQCGKLTELQEQAQQAADAKMLGAEHLLALTLIAMAAESAAEREEAEKYLEGFFSREQPTTLENSPYQKSSLNLADYQVYLAALKNKLYFDRTGERFAPFDVRLRSGQARSYRAMARRNYVNHLLETNNQAPLKTLDRWKNWVSFRQTAPSNTTLETWWLGDENSATHISGSGLELLAFAYPLTGDFEFTIECYNGDWGECDVGYGSVIAQAQRWGSQMTVMTTGGHESLPRKQALKTTQPSYGEYRLVSKEGNLTVFLNGYKVYEEALSDTSPWLMLATEGTRTSRFMNPRISGNPTIPRQVQLLSGQRMDGWSTSAFSQSQPRQRTMAEKVTDENNYLAYQQRNEPTSFTWETKNGVLHGVQADGYSDDQAWIFYQRPLREGETLEYEFLYQPGVATVAPTFGQLAMLLEPTGVESHWISSRPLEEQITGVKPNNQIVETAYQTSSQLPLKPGEWNKVAMQWLDGHVHLAVNDIAVFKRPTAGLNDQRFGLFHYTNTRVEVRNATLRGDWPETVDEAVRDGWFQRERQLTPQQLAMVKEILPRELEQPQLRQIVMQSRELTDDEAFTFLQQWILPSEHDLRIRLGFAYLPLDEQKQLDLQAAPLDSVLSPALELVRTAQRLGRIDELLKQIDSLQPQTAVDQRNQRALRLLTRLQDPDADCSEELAAVYRGLEKALPKSHTPMERSADFLVAVEAGRSPRHWAAGYDLAQRLQAHERNADTSSGNGAWQSSVHSLVGSIALRWSGSPPTATATSTTSTDTERNTADSSQWTSVPYLKPEWRHVGERNSSWLVDRGAFTHVPGQHWSQLVFQSPLRGNYEITARRSTHGYKEVSIATGMHAVDPKHDLQAIRITKVMHNQEEKPREVKLPAWDQSADFRIVVDDNSVTTHVNGVQLHRQPFRVPRDPWLVLQADVPGTYASVRDLRITGNPTIPDEIDLIDIDGWASWRFDMYGDWSAQQAQAEVPYNRVGEEIVGNVRADRSASPMESLMMYSRPMLEDGEIEFETFYVKGELEVHPTLGRTALMLDQEKLSLHRLSDAQWQRGDPTVDNRQQLPDAAPLTMKTGDWNRIRLKLAGDKLTLFVNDQSVGEVEVSEPKQERFFGLFRYSDLTGCRVRNLKYRGEWPKTLPAVEEQYAAYPSSGPYVLEGLPQTTSYDLAGSTAELEKLGGKLLGQAEQVSPAAGGLALRLENGDQWNRWPGVSVTRDLQGDCEITVSYRDLAIQAGENGWGACLALQVSLDDPQESSVEISVRKNGAGEPKTQGSLRRKMPDGQPSSLDLDAITGHNAAGRLRLVRQGGRIHCLVSDGDEETFRLIHSLTIGSAPIRQISVQAKSSDTVGQVNVVVSDLTIRE
jgi:tetratricopeptide (TPR) repeat protein